MFEMAGESGTQTIVSGFYRGETNQPIPEGHKTPPRFYVHRFCGSGIWTGHSGDAVCSLTPGASAGRLRRVFPLVVGAQLGMLTGHLHGAPRVAGL